MKEMAKRFEKSLGYIESQVARAEKEGKPRTSGPTITISRETGTGAMVVADKLVEHLDQQLARDQQTWAVFDKNLVAKVLEEHNLPERLAKFMPEDGPSHVKDVVEDMLGMHPPNWSLVKRTNETIYRLARMGHCVLVGRGANIITRDLPDVLHLRLIAPLERRIRRYADYHGISEDKARERVRKTDRARRRYLLTYFDEEIDDPTNYHLVVNVDRVTTNSLARLISAIISHK